MRPAPRRRSARTCNRRNSTSGYDCALGEGISRDPIGELGSLNLYGFVHNAPSMHLDVLGRCAAGDSSLALNLSGHGSSCKTPCMGSVNLPNADPQPIQDRTILKGVCGPWAACAWPKYLITTKCERCSSECSWRVVIEVDGVCKMAYADPNSIQVEYRPDGVNSAIAHEKCHCDDYRAAFGRIVGSYDAAGYSSKESCEVARANAESKFGARLEEEMRFSAQHRYGKYERGRECYATGQLK